jgi:hypothetical protein
MKIIHEIHPGATPATGSGDHAGAVSICLVGRHPITNEIDVLRMEGDAEDVLAAIEQMVVQVRLCMEVVP